jgi:CDP-diacylglycerol--glycerol-3-phosphate 3-phosphatidyltransferase
VLALRAIARTEPEPGASDALLGPRIRAWYRGLMGPIADRLVGWQVHPDTLTFAQLGVSVLAGAAFAVGWIFIGGWLTILAGSLDVLDGAVARQMGVAGPRGALVDSIVDRWAEFATFLGVGAFFRDSWVVLAVVVAAFGSQMVSYTRARAEGLGLQLDGGSAQRPERFVILGLGAALSGIVAHLACPALGYQTHAVLVVAVVILAAAAGWTAVQRAVRAVQALPRSVP